MCCVLWFLSQLNDWSLAHQNKNLSFLLLNDFLKSLPRWIQRSWLIRGCSSVNSSAHLPHSICWQLIGSNEDEHEERVLRSSSWHKLLSDYKHAPSPLIQRIYDILWRRWSEKNIHINCPRVEWKLVCCLRQYTKQDICADGKVSTTDSRLRFVFGKLIYCDKEGAERVIKKCPRKRQKVRCWIKEPENLLMAT